MFVPAYVMGLGLPELAIILVIVLIIFGPRKLPEIGKALGQTVREMRKSSQTEDKTGDDAKAEAKSEPEQVEAETKQEEKTPTA